MASLDTVPLTGPGVQAFSYVVGSPGPGVQPLNYTLASGPSSQAAFSYTLTPGITCWESYTQRLLAWLAAPFKQAATGLLHDLVGTVARELSVCTQAVSIVRGTDTRGNGSWVVTTRFEPITGVPLVERVDAVGNVLETYTVVSYSGRQITLSGTTPPKSGDFLVCSYSYTHEGLEARVQEALAQLNVLTAAADWLDRWGQWFAVPRLPSGKYGSEKYGPPSVYGTRGVEADNQYARRMIDRITEPRNTDAAVLGAVQRAVGGSPFIVAWFDGSGPRGFVFRPTGVSPWDGGPDTTDRLVWGRSAKWLDPTAADGGGCVFDVWVTRASGYSANQILEIVNSYKAAGTKAFVRYYD